MVSRNYNIQSDKMTALNAKSPNNGIQSNSSGIKTSHASSAKPKQNIHYKQASVGTQYNMPPNIPFPKENASPKSSRYLYSSAAPKSKPEKTHTSPTYTSTVNQDLSSKVDLKTIAQISENTSTFTYLPTNRESGISCEPTNPRINCVDTSYQQYSTNYTSPNPDNYSLKSYKVRAPQQGNGSSVVNNNLPTIAESVIEDNEVGVDVQFGGVYSKSAKCRANAALRGAPREPPPRDPARECPLGSADVHQDHYCGDYGGSPTRSGRFHYTEHPVDITDSLKGYQKYKYQGTHPDSLYRVAGLGGEGGRWTRRAARVRQRCRLLRWPLALAAAGAVLALLVYFLMPEMTPPLLLPDNYNSTEWLQGEEQSFRQGHAGEGKAKGADESLLDGNNLGQGQPNMETTSKKPEETTPSDKGELIFGYADDDNLDDEGLERFVELIPALGKEPVGNGKSTSTTPSPLFPTNISPSVQYGNEHSDADSNEKRTFKKPIQSVPVTDIYDNKFLTQTFAIFYKDLESTTSGSQESVENVQETQNVHSPNIQAKLNAPSFTSGHQNSFGIPIEEASKLKTTTQSAVYNTRVSPTLPTMVGRNRVRSTTVRSRWNATEDGVCHSTSLSMCRGVLPYDLTTAPLVPGASSAAQLAPHFQPLLGAACSPRARQFVCALLEPECKPRGMTVLPPCRRACKAIAESCQDVIASTLELSQVFNCGQYPEEECARPPTGPCLAAELRCSKDGSCVPLHWRCDSISDCPGGTDELDCDGPSCSPAEFKCGNHGSCIPEEWVCDGHQDCPAAEDEASCGGAGDVLSAASFHPRPVRLPRPVYTAKTKSAPEYESSKELLMMSDSVMPVAKPLVSLTARNTRKSIGTAKTTTTTTPRVPSTTTETPTTPIVPVQNITENSTSCINGTCEEDMQPMETTTDFYNDYYKSQIIDAGSAGTSHSSPCPQGELRCVDGRCITLAQLCDHQTDCSDGADEANCFP